MKNILRFSIIESISMLLLCLLGISAGFSLAKNGRLALLNFSYQLLAMIVVTRNSKTVYPLRQVCQNFYRFIKNTLLIPILITLLLIIQIGSRSTELRFFYLNVLIMVYTIGSIFSLDFKVGRKT